MAMNIADWAMIPGRGRGQPTRRAVRRVLRNIAEISCLVVETAARHVAEDVLQRGRHVGGHTRGAAAGPESLPELGRGAEGPDPAAVHQGGPVAVLVGLVHGVGGHEHGHAGGRADRADVLPDA
jgi:hypothetical protein